MAVVRSKADLIANDLYFNPCAIRTASIGALEGDLYQIDDPAATI